MSLENYPKFLPISSEVEMNGDEKHFYQFKSFRLNVGERQLLNEDKTVPLTPKAFDVLVLLIERNGHLVEKDEILQTVWADSFVEEANIPRIIHTLRRTLGEDENGNKFIETVPTKGYRFVAEVTEIPLEVGDHPLDVEQILTNTDRQLPTEKNPPAKPKMRFILFAVGFASAVGLFLLLSFNFSSKSKLDPNEVKSIAVLPLKSLTEENRNAVYEIGVPDSIIAKLSAAKNLIVRPLSATAEYADGKKDAIAVGKEQNVDYVLASNYQIADGKIRITSQLINVADGTIEETFKDERDAANIFAVQDGFAENIGQKLLAKLNRQTDNAAPKRYTTNEEAYRLYLQGRVLSNKQNRKDAEKAVEYLQKAVELDPNFALAYAQLANAHSALANFGGDNHEEYGKAKTAVEKALSLDENLADAHARLGEIKLSYEWDFVGAETALKKAVELDPNSIVAHRIYALYLNSMGRFDESIAEAKIAIDLEPASVLNHKNYAQFLFFARRYDESNAQALRTVEMDPNFRVIYGWLINSYKMKGENDKAFEWFLKSPAVAKTNPETIPVLKEIYAKSGWRGVNEHQLQDARDWEKPGIYAELGDKENTILSLEKNFKDNQRGWMWTTLKIDPSYDFIRSDPRFENLVRRVGLK